MLQLLVGRLMGNKVMPKKAKELSAIAVSHIKAPGLHSVGGVLAVSSCKLQKPVAEAGYLEQPWQKRFGISA